MSAIINPEMYDNGENPLYVVSGYNGYEQRKALSEVDQDDFLKDQDIYDGESHEASQIEFKVSKKFVSVNEELGVDIIPTPSVANVPDCIWESSDETIAYVTPENKVFGKNEGEVTITATSASNGIKAEISLTVTYEDSTTAQKEENATEITDQLAEQGGGEVVITTGTVDSINIPETVTKTSKVTAALDPETTITSTSSKGLYVYNQSEEPCNVTIDAPSVSTVYLTGNNAEITTNTSIKATEGEIEEVNINPETGKAVTVNATFADEATVNNPTEKTLSLTNSNKGAEPSVEIVSPNSTVNLSASWNTVVAETGDNTLNVNTGSKINKLVVKKGNVIVKNAKVENQIFEIVNDTEYTVTPRKAEVANYTEYKSSILSPGITEFTADIEQTGTQSTGILASGDYIWNFGEHNLTATDGVKNGLWLIRGTTNTIDIYSEGNITNETSYGMWVSAEKSVVNVYGGNWLCNTHALYAEKGTINVYGGTFAVNGEDKRYVLNCLDASYQSGKANINVYGGRYIDFNPAESISEPGGPVSFVAPGFKSVQVDEHTWEVVPE